MLKENHGEIKEAIALVMEEAVRQRKADVVQMEKRHGRLERRSYWWVQVDEALRSYLGEEYGWKDVQWCGLARRRWRRLRESEWHEEEERLFVFSARDPVQISPKRLSQLARRHWHTENRVFWVLDVTYQEDRNHARRVGPQLHMLRVLAINIIRHQGFRYVPDGRRSAAARSDRGLAWLLAP